MRIGRARDTTAVTLTIVALGLAVAACSGDEEAGDGTSTTSSDVETASNGDVFNEADVEFATRMIPHHAQAIQMVTLTDGRTLDPGVQQLANQIRDTQAPQVETMVDWLTAWEGEIPETSLDHTNAGHDMTDVPEVEGAEDVPGMMSAEEMEALMHAPDSEFQDLWLQRMKEHHQGAIGLAATQQQDGEFPEAVALAEAIAAAQQDEVAVIDQLMARE